MRSFFGWADLLIGCSRLLVCGGLVGCTSHEPIASPAVPAQLPATELAAPPPAASDAARADVAAPKPLTLRIEPSVVERPTSDVAQSRWASLLTLPNDPSASQGEPESRSARWLQLPESVAIAWLQLDDGMPRRVSASGTLPVAELQVELSPALSGEHRVAWFATDAAGRLLFDAAGQPLLDVRSVLFGDTAAEAAAPQVVSPPPPKRCRPAAWIAPHGTFNGESTQAIPLQFWAASPRTLIVHDEQQRRFETELAPGAYSITGLSAGDYSLQLRAPGCEPQQVTITTNPELGPQAQQ